MSDFKLFRWLLVLLVIPVAMIYFSGERFRYPCQDPDNWDKPVCQKPACDVVRSCPEHVFKGQRDPRLGPPEEPQNILAKQQRTCNTQNGIQCNVK